MEQELRAQIARDIEDIKVAVMRIESRAEFDILMKNILDPYVEREVRKLLIPLLLFAYTEDE